MATNSVQVLEDQGLPKAIAKRIIRLSDKMLHREKFAPTLNIIPKFHERDVEFYLQHLDHFVFTFTVLH